MGAFKTQVIARVGKDPVTITSRPFLIDPVREFSATCAREPTKVEQDLMEYRYRSPGGEIDLPRETKEEVEASEFLMWQYIMEAV